MNNRNLSKGDVGRLDRSTIFTNDKKSLTVKPHTLVLISERMDDTCRVELPDGSSSIVHISHIYSINLDNDRIEYINSFETALRYCRVNEMTELVREYNNVIEGYYKDSLSRDLKAYIKLRIVINALNGGWKFDGNNTYEGHYIMYSYKTKEFISCYACRLSSMPNSLILKSDRVVDHIMKYFSYLYLDFYTL